MRKAVTLSLLLLVVVAFAANPRPPRIDPETGLPEELIPERLMEKHAQPPSEEYLNYLAREAEGQIAQTDAQWDPDYQLTNNTTTDYVYAMGRHTIAVDPSGRIHVVWMSYQTPGTYSPQVYYKRYYPGSGWTSDTCISADIASIGYSYYPALCVDSSGNVHAAWYVYKVASTPTGYYIAYKMCTPTSSGNGGWEATTTRITEDTLLWYKYYPSIEASPNGRIHVVYYNYYSTFGYAIGYKEKIGTTWQPRVWVDSGSTSYYRWWPKVAADRNNNIHVTWYGYAGTTYYQIGYRGRFGGTWGPVQQNISGGVYYQYYPSIAVNPVTNRVHIVWCGYPPNYSYSRIIHKQRLGTGVSDTFQLVGDTVSEPGYTYYQYYPTITFTKDGRGHVVWSGASSSNPSYYQIRYNERTPAGTWGTPINLTNVNAYCYYPSINNGGNSPDSNHVHVVWNDARDGDYEVFYKHGAPPAPYDVGVSRIVAPSGMLAVGDTVQPAAWVKNYGTATVSGFGVKMDIGTAYSSTVTVSTSIAPGDSYLVNTFSLWVPATSGSYAVKCSTQLSGDGNPSNDKKTGAAMVVDFVEHFEPTDGNYRGTGAWTWRPPAPPRPPAVSSPNVWTNPDSGYYNNNALDSLISCTYIATQDTPTLMFYHWMYVESYWDGGGVYYSTNDGATWTLMYPDTTGGRRPYYGTLSTGHIGWSGSFPWEIAVFHVPVTNGTPFRIMWLFTSDASVTYVGGWMIDDVAGFGFRKPVDVAATQILAPTGTIPYGVPVVPRAVVWNYGSGTQSFDVKFDIGTVYTSTKPVTGLAPNSYVEVEFDTWTPLAAGTFATKCSTRLGIDEIPDNDKVEGSVFVYLVDVQPTAIVQPVGTVDSGTVIAPQVRVKNNGSQSASFYVRLQIGDSYNQQRLVVGLTPGEERLVTGFPNWTASQCGTFAVRCTTMLTGDMIPENDLLADSVMVVYTDVAVLEVVEPTSHEYLSEPITPTVRVRNNSSQTKNFDLHFVITDELGTEVYNQTEALELEPGEEVVHAFTTTWTPTTAGNYLATSFVAVTGDADPTNDTAQIAFAVTARYAPGWKEMASILGEVKDGGWLAVNPDNGLIYAARGNKSGDFYAYDPNADTAGAWTTLAPIPAAEGKLPRKGAAGCYGGGYVYATTGNNTFAFQRYSVADNIWEPLAPVPAGTSGKALKGGTDMVYVVENDTGYVYLLKGYKQDFFRYNTVSGVWEPLPDAPAGVKPKWDKGSWLVYIDDDPTWIAAHKAKYSEMWRFDLTTHQWDATSLPGMPTSSSKTGKNKKSKDGAGAAYYNGFIYALKGGNTVELWKCEVAGGTYAWTELDPMPEVGSSGRKKRVKAGGDLASYGDGAFYALKGGKTREFWRYFEPVVMSAAPERSGVMAEKVNAVRFGFSVAPNPVVKGYGVLNYSVPQAGEARLVVFDVTGRAVKSLGFVASGTGSRNLDLRDLAAGVYLVKFTSGDNTATQKLVVR